MVRRLISIPLALILAIAVFTFFSSAADYDVTTSFSFSYNDTDYSFDIPSIQNGSPSWFLVDILDDGTKVNGLSQTISSSYNVNISSVLSFDLDIYIRSSDFSSNRYDIGDFADYSYTSSTSSLTIQNNSYYYSVNDRTLTPKSSGTVTESCVILSFSGLPAGSYTFSTIDRNYGIVGYDLKNIVPVTSSDSSSPPQNIIEGVFDYTVFYGDSSTLVSLRHTEDGSTFSDFEYGNVYGAAFYNGNSMYYKGRIIDTTGFGTCDLYIPVLSSSLSYIDPGILSSFYYPSGNISGSVSIPVQFWEFTDDSLLFSSVQLRSLSIIYMCFRIPAGSYSIDIYDNNPAVFNGSIGSYIQSDTGARLPGFAFGVFVSPLGVSSDTIIDDYLNGDLSFSEAITDINNHVSQNISNAQTTDQAILEVLVGQQKIDQLTQASNDKSLNNVTNAMQPSLDAAHTVYQSGNATLQETLSTMSSTFASQLSSAETPEQAVLVATTYQIALKKLELEAQVQAKIKLDSAISDDEMQEFSDYYESESEVIESFDIEEFKSQLALDTWMLQLPSDESANYKKFFDYILNESPFRFFIIVPMCCGLISIVLGTRIVLHDRAVPMSDEEKYWKSQSENYYNFRGG